MNSLDSKNYIELLDRYCLRDNLATLDSYDIWTWPPGFIVKKFYNQHPLAALPFAAFLAVLDRSSILSPFFPKREYPIARATATLTLLNLFQVTGSEKYLEQARKNLEWLEQHRGVSGSGVGWGVLVPRAVSKNLVYPASMTYATISPYCLEAFHAYSEISGDSRYEELFPKFKIYFMEDIRVMRETEDELMYSYSTLPDRIVVNANSYNLFSQALLYHILQEEPLKNNVLKIYNFIRNNQGEDGSWLYSYEAPNSFIDCFHSCFIIKNIIKASRYIPLPDSEAVIRKGWSFIKSTMYDQKAGLFLRFARANKPGIVKYDLYDNAEALNIGILLNEEPLVSSLAGAISKHFICSGRIYSKIDKFGNKTAPDHLRWAVMPYLYALSCMLKK